MPELWRKPYEYRRAIARLSCKLGRDMNHSQMSLEEINALLDWKLNKYAEAKAKAKEGNTMQNIITIECKMDFADKDKIPELTKIACSMARTLVANVSLLGPVTKPECVVFTDDFMSGPEKINIYADLIGQGQAATGDTATVTEEAPSDELLAAMK